MLRFHKPLAPSKGLSLSLNKEYFNDVAHRLLSTNVIALETNQISLKLSQSQRKTAKTDQKQAF